MSIDKILYFTQDVYSYKQGNYYSDWLEVFQKNSDVTIVNSIQNEVELSEFQFVVFGHSFIDVMISNLKVFNKRYLNKMHFMVIQELKYLLRTNKLLNKIKNSDTKKIYFSKNDYKAFPEKVLISNFLNIDLFISHTKNSLEVFKKYGLDAKIEWLPFSVSKEKYFQTKDKKFHIGMRANSNSYYNNGEREQFYNQVKELSNDKYIMDLHLSQKGECFLHGQNYIDWLSECNLLVNSVSAYGTVGPKFLEAIACGTISLALEDEYEGFLIGDKHYISIKKDFSNLEKQISKFFNDHDFRNYLLENSKNLLDEYCIDNQYKKLITDIKK